MYGTSYFNSAAVTTGNRYVLYVGGINFAGRANVQLGRVTFSIQGPGGTSQMTFTVEHDYGGAAIDWSPFFGRQAVIFYDTLSDVAFVGFIVHTSFTRSKGVRRVITVTCAGLDKLLDDRLIDSFKTRTSTGERIRKFFNDDILIKAILAKANLDSLWAGYTTIANTTTTLDDMHFSGQTVRECLQEIADVAQALTEYETRRFYVDAVGILHYYKGLEGLAAPWRIDDDNRYLPLMLSTASLAEFWSGRLQTGGNQVYGHNAHISADINGGVTSTNSLCIGHPELPGLLFNGTSGYLDASDASLHPGNTGTWGCVFKRSATGTQQAIFSGGTDDILIGFDASDHIRVQKEGTGDAWVSNTTITSRILSYHLVVTHSAGNGTTVYLNGSSIAGTATPRTFSAGSGTVQIGRKKSTASQQFAGTLWGVFVTGAELSSAAVATRFQRWISAEPENLVIDRDSTDVTRKVYVKGKTATASGWFSPPLVNDPNFERVLGPEDGGPVLPEEFIDRPDAETLTKAKKYANSYMSAKAGTVVGATFSMTYDPSIIRRPGVGGAWRPGQTVYITSNDALGWSAHPLEVKQVDVDLNEGNGVTTFDVTAGSLPFSVLRNIRSKGMQ